MKVFSNAMVAVLAAAAAISCSESTPPPTPVSVSFDRNTATLLLDDSLSTIAVVTNSDNTRAVNAGVVYTSSAMSVATVDATGRIRTLATGSATITATDGTLHADMMVTVVPQFTQLATGQVHTCGITGTQRLYCWGDDINGALGTDTGTSDCTAQIGGACSLLPIPVEGAERFVSVTAGEFHTCALTKDGIAYCWGGNPYGQLGIGTTGGEKTLPTQVIGGHIFNFIGAGRMHTCGIDTAGDTYCWGWDEYAQLGTGVTASGSCTFFGTGPCSGTPLKVVGNNRFVAVTGSEKNTCARDVAGAIYCWGFTVGGANDRECAPNVTQPRCTRTPALQVGGVTFSAFGIGGNYRCGQKSDGTLWCWGIDSFGLFGNGLPDYASDTLVRAAGGKSYSQVAFGRIHTCGLNAGSVECWGGNYVGQAGGTIGVDRTTPGLVGGGVTFASITTGPNADHNCGISTAGRAYCWGYGTLGQLGNGTFQSSAVPVLVKLVR